MRYVYCPLCGTKLTTKAAGDDGMVPYCAACGRYWFDTFASVAIVMVVNEYGEIAMLKQHYLSLDHHAGECIACRGCESRCPFGVKVADRMTRTAELFGG